MAEWKIRRRQGECNACGRLFEGGERHASLLRVEAEELSRGDLCEPCWEGRVADEGDVIFWFTHHDVDKKRTLALDLATMERLFFELEERDAPALAEVRYLLCLLLMRKRKLKLARVKRTKDAELLLVRRPRRKELHAVQVFDFDAERMDELRTRLQEVLEGAPLEEGGESVDAGEASEDLAAPVARARREARSGVVDGDGDGDEPDACEDAARPERGEADASRAGADADAATETGSRSSG